MYLSTCLSIPIYQVFVAMIHITANLFRFAKPELRRLRTFVGFWKLRLRLIDYPLVMRELRSYTAHLEDPYSQKNPIVDGEPLEVV